MATRLKQTPWWLLLSVQFMTVATPLAMLPFLSLHVQRLSGVGGKDVAIWTALIAAAPAIGAVLSTPIWARSAATYPLGRLLSLSCLVNAVSAVLQAHASSVEIFALGRSLQGLTGIGILLLLGVDNSLTSAGKGYSGLQQALAAGCIAGPLLGGLAFDHDAFPALLTGCALSLAVLSVFCGFFVRAANLVTAKGQYTGFFIQLPSSGTRILILSAMLATAGAFGFMPFFASWAMERGGAVFTASLVGFIHAVSWMAAIAVLPLWGKGIDSGREIAAVRLSVAGSVAALLLLLTGSTVVWISLWRMAHGALNSGLSPSLFARLGRSKHRIVDLAAGRMAITLGQIIGPAICGLAVSAAGNDGALFAAALLTLLGATLLYLQPEAQFHDGE